MTKQLIRDELIERYNETGRVGLSKPKSISEAFKMIDTIVDLYEEEEKEEYNFTLKDITNRLRTYLNNF